MELFALAVAALVVLGAPASAIVSLRRSMGRRCEAVELVAVAFGGVAIAGVAIWFAALLAGLSTPVILAASLLASAVLWGVALMGGPSAASIGTSAGTSSATSTVASLRSRYLLPLLGSGVLFAILCWLPFLTYGLTRADGVHRMAMTDWYKHLVTGTALAAGDVFPPPNPFAHTVEAAPYYYGFHLVGASISRVAASITGEAPAALLYPALLGLTLATALATPFVAFAVARTILSGGNDGADRPAFYAALGATFLAGFDLIPLALDTAANVVSTDTLPGGFAGLRAAIPATHLDYWIHHNERQFNAPYLTTIWAPQHMAAVLIALLVIHLVLERCVAADGDNVSRGAPGLLMPALLLGALPAFSAYVAVGLIVGVGGALIVESCGARCPPWRTTAWRLWWAVGCGALVVSLPVAAVLADGSDAAGLVFHVSAAGRWVNGALFTALLGSVWYTGLLDSFAVYVMELGIVGMLAAIEILRPGARSRLSPHRRHVAWAALAMMLFVLFVRPPVGGPNNLYARPLVLVWFLWAPFAAVRWTRWCDSAPRAGDRDRRSATAGGARRTGRAPAWAVIALAICLLANGYALLGVLLEGALFWATPPETVAVAAWVNENADPRGIVAIAPDEYDSGLGYWLRRRLALGDERHALLFGAAPQQFRRAADRLAQARQADAAGTVLDALRDLEADLFLVSREAEDPPWREGGCITMRFANDRWLLLQIVQRPDCVPTSR